MIVAVACLAGANLLAAMRGFEVSAPLLLFLGLLTVINAPCDWASLGLTRWLLRRGLAQGGWAPFGFAIADAVAATAVIAVLSLAMLLGVQAFDDMAMHAGAKPTLPLRPLLDGLTEHPEAPEYWWLYATLLVTMVPSAINLSLGWLSLLRGIPSLNRLMLRHMPAGKAVADIHRLWIVPALTGQLVLGFVLGIAVQGGLVWVIFRYVAPFIGFDLLAMAKAVEAMDLPRQVGQAALTWWP